LSQPTFHLFNLKKCKYSSVCCRHLFNRWQMDREPPLSVVCTNLQKSAKNSLAKMLPNFQIVFKNICMKFKLHLVIQCPFSLLKKYFFKKMSWGFFNAKISVENERFGSYRIERRSKTNDYRPLWDTVNREDTKFRYFWRKNDFSPKFRLCSVNKHGYDVYDFLN
jgi:hypothetical protein